MEAGQDVASDGSATFAFKQLQRASERSVDLAIVVRMLLWPRRLRLRAPGLGGVVLTVLEGLTCSLPSSKAAVRNWRTGELESVHMLPSWQV